MEKITAATIPLFDICAFPADQIGHHVQQTWELTYIHSGTGKRIIGDFTDTILTGEVILIPPGIPHCWAFDNPKQRIRSLTVMIPPDFFYRLPELFPELEERLANIRQLNAAIEYTGELRARIADELLRMSDLKPAMRIGHMINLIVLLSDTSHTNSAGHHTRLSATKRKLGRLDGYCKCNYNKHITLAGAAAYMGMNKSAFCIFVKRATGLTFSQFLNEIKLQYALEMLADKDHRISAIAYECGFASVPYFNRVFKRTFGTSPKAYRQNQFAYT